jgi:phospholipid transport system substrate-binding protein
MIRRSLLVAVFVLTAAASNAAPPPVNPADAVAFMNQLWSRAVELLSKKADPAIREASFRQLFHEDFDAPGIARFVLGRYWRTVNEDEQKEFVKLFEDYVVFVYTARLSDFGGGQSFKVRGSHSDGDGVIVSTDVVSPGNPTPLRIDWRLITDNNGSYKINDVIVEGISMTTTQRSEFASVVQRNGGQVRSLISMMREKAATATR